MSTKVRDIMTTPPVSLPLDAPLTEAARLMRDRDVDGVLVTQGEILCGLLTDRDIVVRAVAAGRDLAATPLRDVCSAGLVTVSPEEDTAAAARVMSEEAVHHLPVVETGRAIGIVLAGDLTGDGAAPAALPGAGQPAAEPGAREDRYGG